MTSPGFLDDALRLLLPPAVRCASAPIDEVVAFRHAAEADVVARAVAKRVREFATGRRLAHDLLDALGCVDVPLLPDDRRAPRWPVGVRGTIAHCRDGCVVAVTTDGRIAGLGLDIEPATPLRAELVRRILADDEREVLAARDEAERGLLAKAAFCAKEAVYKAISARVGVVLEFSDVRLALDALHVPGDDEGGADDAGPCRPVAELVRAGLPLPCGTRLEVGVVRRAGVLLAGAVLPA